MGTLNDSLNSCARRRQLSSYIVSGREALDHMGLIRYGNHHKNIDVLNVRTFACPLALKIRDNRTFHDAPAFGDLSHRAESASKFDIHAALRSLLALLVYSPTTHKEKSGAHWEFFFPFICVCCFLFSSGQTQRGIHVSS